MDLALDIVRTTGRAPRAVTGALVRELEEGDLALLAEERGVKASPVKRLSERHHALARAIASGSKPGEAAAITGYDNARVSVLLSDPAFKELVIFYREDVERRYAGLHEVMAGMSVDAALLIRERLEEEGGKIPLGELREIVKLAADRTGYGPSSKQEVNVNVNLATRLEEARKRIAQRTIDLTPTKDPEE